MSGTHSMDEVRDYALENSITIQRAAHLLRAQDQLRLVNRATTMEELKPILRFLLMEDV